MTRTTYEGNACSRCGCTVRFTSNRTCRDCNRYRNNFRSYTATPADEKLAQVEEAYRLAAAMRVRWVFDWGTALEQPTVNCVTGNCE